MARFDGKVAIVTGASTLIGACVVDAFAAAGGAVVMADIAEDDGKKIAQRLGDRVAFVRTDVTSDADIDACLKQATDRYSGIDYLVNVACTYTDGGVETTREQWLTGLNVNLVGMAVFGTKVVPFMRRRGGGAIVNYGSISGKIAQPGRMVYAVSKAGILHMTRVQAAALAKDRIRVNSVSPGWTWSNAISFLSNNRRERADAVAASVHPMGRAGDPQEVANAVVFLCSDEASWITGTDIAVDGGYTSVGPERMDDMVPLLAQ